MLREERCAGRDAAVGVEGGEEEAHGRSADPSQKWRREPNHAWAQTPMAGPHSSRVALFLARLEAALPLRKVLF
jgi:hypothetical protein